MDNLVISPEPFIQKCRSLAKAKNLYLNVMDGLVRLAWTSYSDDSAICLTESIDRIEGIRLGISYEMIMNALEEAGGTIGINGRYPINDAIWQRLRKVLDVKEKA